MSSDRASVPFDLETVDRLLTTTRAVRRRLDLHRAVPVDVVHECLPLAVQAPTGSNLQTWRWVVVTSPEIRNALAELYRNPLVPAASPPRRDLTEALSSEAQERMHASTEFLRDHL